MQDEKPAHSGKNITSHGLLQGVGAPKPGEALPVSGGSPDAGKPLFRGTSDIAITLRDGSSVYFPGTAEGIADSNAYAEKHGQNIYTAHFGESCWYFKDGRGMACVNMTRAEFAAMVVPS